MKKLSGVLNGMNGISHKLKVSPPLKQYRIGEVAHYSGLSRQTVHNYTVMGLISEEQWTEGGHRLYNETVFERLARIEDMKQMQTLREIRVRLDQEQTQDQSKGTDKDLVCPSVG